MRAHGRRRAGDPARGGEVDREDLQWRVAAAGGATRRTTKPAAGEAPAEAGTASIEDVTRAGAAAHEARRTWARAAPLEHAEPVSEWIVRESGGVSANGDYPAALWRPTRRRSSARSPP